MTRTIFIILFSFLLSGLFGCDRHVNNARLAEADSLMFISPEKSLSILESITDKSGYSRGELAEYAFLLSQARSRNHITPENDSLIKIAIDYYAQHKDARRRAWCHVVASDVYDVLGNDSLAIFYARDAEKLSQNIGDLRLKCYANYFLGYMLRYQQPYEESSHYLNEAKKYAKEINDTSHIILSLIDLSGNALSNTEYDETLSYLYQAIPYCKSPKWNTYQPFIHAKLSAVYAQKKDFQTALLNVNRSLNLICPSDSITNSSALFQLKGNILADMGQWDSVPYFAKKGLTDSAFVTRGMYDITMMKWAEGTGNYRKALEYSKHYAEMLDSIYKEKTENKMMEMQRKYDLTQAKIESDRLKIKSQHNSIITLGVLLACCALTIVVIISINLYKKLRRERKEHTSERNRRLIADERRRHRLLSHNDVIAKVMSINRHDDKEQLKRGNGLSLTADETAKLIEAVDECYEGYLTKLAEEHPSLNQNDLAICAMILLKVPNRDMVILSGLSYDTMKKRKLRLRNEKLCIDKNVDDWLMNESRVYVDDIDAKYNDPDNEEAKD